MEIKTSSLLVLADLESGVREIKSLRLADTRFGPVTAAARFRFGDGQAPAGRIQPTTLLEESGAIRLNLGWHGHNITDRVTMQVRWQPTEAPDEPSGLLITAQLTNESAAPIQLDSLSPLLYEAGPEAEFRLGYSPLEWSILRNGWQSWSATRMFRATEKNVPPVFDWLAAMEENVANLSPNKKGVFLGEQVLLVRNVSGGQNLVLGFLTAKRAFSDLRLEIKPRQAKVAKLEACCRFDGIRVAPGETIAAEPLWLCYGGHNEDPLDAWAARSGRAMEARVPRRSPVGWCSWYYFYTKVSQDTFLANLEKLAGLREAMQLDVFQLDDGYQTAIGDWLDVNEKFPDGLAYLVERIRAAGFSPGIWTAPFLAHPKSRLAREHPDWLLRNRRGKPLYANYNPIWDPWTKIRAVDPTHPEVQEWLTDTFATLRGMGWEFFKIDFLYAVSLPAERHDPSLTRAGALRAGLEAIRRGVGPEPVILGCGCPLGPAVGIADLMRIGPDVTPRWTNPMRWVLRDHNCLSTRHAVRNTIQRNFLHRRWWINDPDCVLARENKNKLTLDEVRTFASLAAISGGMFLLSDDMTEYPEARLQLVRTALAHRTQGMRVLDPERGEFPSQMFAATDRGYLFLYINHDSAEINPIFDLKDVLPIEQLARIRHVREIWQDRQLIHQDGLMRLGPIPKHGCRFLEILTAENGMEPHG
ncbi:MAG: alpha-galactosidase [Myxococcales bacterium]|nr:alpha-galactosidase [Myxococcales bacterium]